MTLTIQQNNNVEENVTSGNLSTVLCALAKNSNNVVSLTGKVRVSQAVSRDITYLNEKFNPDFTIQATEELVRFDDPVLHQIVLNLYGQNGVIPKNNLALANSPFSSIRANGNYNDIQILDLREFKNDEWARDMDFPTSVTDVYLYEATSLYMYDQLNKTSTPNLNYVYVNRCGQVTSGSSGNIISSRQNGNNNDPSRVLNTLVIETPNASISTMDSTFPIFESAYVTNFYFNVTKNYQLYTTYGDAYEALTSGGVTNLYVPYEFETWYQLNWKFCTNVYGYDFEADPHNILPKNRL